jgi:ribosomal RNA-processing protein 7
MASVSLIKRLADIDIASIKPLKFSNKSLYSDPDELRKKVDAFMVAYDRAEAEMRKKSKQKEIDEDGFELVKPSFSNTIPVASSVSTKKRKTSSEGLSDFYRFQLKERKIAEWSAEKKQEAIDKDRINQMRSENKFQL